MKNTWRSFDEAKIIVKIIPICTLVFGYLSHQLFVSVRAKKSYDISGYHEVQGDP